jgi:ABC-type nitrate/sulfonate/bicarbonate transport system ATPase subunit
MSDRIIIMAPRPGRIDRSIDVNLSRPRRRNGYDFLSLRALIMDLMHLASKGQGHPPPQDSYDDFVA